MDRGAADGSRQDVLTTVTDVKLGSYGRVTALSGIWASCSDFGGQVRYSVKGRVESDASERLVADLGTAGWTPTYDRGESPRRRGLQRAGLSVEVTSYADASFVLVDLLGPCLSTGQQLADELRAEPRTSLL